ncbi:hypothetical protein LIER_02266 [Lithospermum erythrorhizon]|uniref:Uncharacterized protein n=1 Tax=Lithospermum erythrorhizon TaxID=34254 RepID=A0AAV3NNS0_LITER
MRQQRDDVSLGGCSSLLLPMISLPYTSSTTLYIHILEGSYVGHGVIDPYLGGADPDGVCSHGWWISLLHIITDLSLTRFIVYAFGECNVVEE